MSYTRSMRRLEALIRAHEAILEAMHEAAEDVLEEAQARKPGSPRANISGSVPPYQSRDFESFARKAWKQAKTQDRREHVIDMVRRGRQHKVLDEDVYQALMAEFGAED